jgi:hypothetical protein
MTLRFIDIMKGGMTGLKIMYLYVSNPIFKCFPLHFTHNMLDFYRKDYKNLKRGSTLYVKVVVLANGLIIYRSQICYRLDK